MTDILPIIIIAILFAMIGSVIGFHLGYHVLTRKHVCKGSDMLSISCSQYAVMVNLDGGREDIYPWDSIEKLYFDAGGHNLVIRLHSGSEHKYSDAISCSTLPVSELRPIIHWKDR